MNTEHRRALARVFAEHPRVELAMLFGSRTRGTSRADSDVDLAIVADGVDLLELAAELRHAVGLEVDLVELRGAGYPLLAQVLRHGETVYRRDAAAEGSWRAQAISIVELDRAWYERMRDGYLRKLAEQAGG